MSSIDEDVAWVIVMRGIEIRGKLRDVRSREVRIGKKVDRYLLIVVKTKLRKVKDGTNKENL